MILNPWILLAVLLFVIAEGLGCYAYGEHNGKQSGQIETDKIVLAYSNRALEGEEHARQIEEKSNADLQADHDTYTEQIALLKKAQGLASDQLRAGQRVLTLQLDSALTLAANQGSTVTGGPVDHSTVEVPRATGSNLVGYCVDDFNALRLQLAATIKSYGDAAAACGSVTP
jgi:hypothetical protein